MTKRSADWSHEFANFKQIEDGHPCTISRLRTAPMNVQIVDLRESVRKVAIDFFFKHSRQAPAALVESSGVSLAGDVLEECIPYAEAGSRHLLLFSGNDVQMFFVTEDGVCIGLEGYKKHKTLTELSTSKFYMVYTVEEGYGMLEEVSFADLIYNRL